MGTSKPLVSIGMALYNEERYLSQTFECLLAQDYENFELVVSDNASTDRTQEICKQFASKDQRIQYTRLETTVDASENMNRVVGLCGGEYFMWVSGHDRYAPSYISSCLQPMQSDPTVVLCYTEILPMTADGAPLSVLATPICTQGMLGPVLRYLLTFWNLGGYQIHGLFRLETLKRTVLFRHNTIGPDLILIPELALQGTFAVVRRPLYSPRMKWTNETTFDDTLNRYSKMMFIRGATPKFPHWRLFLKQIRSVVNAPLSFKQKFMLIPGLVLLFIAKYRSMLSQDLRRVFHSKRLA